MCVPSVAMKPVLITMTKPLGEMQRICLQFHCINPLVALFNHLYRGYLTVISFYFQFIHNNSFILSLIVIVISLFLLSQKGIHYQLQMQTKHLSCFNSGAC